MFSRIAARNFSSSAANAYKVSILGAAGGIGQPLSLLLKLNGKVTDLSLYDLKLAKGVAADLSHIPTKSVVHGFTLADDGLSRALQNADVVLIPAGVPRKPGMTRDDLFNTNASIVKGLAEACAENCPSAAICVISNPVNSTVPIVREVLKRKGVFNPQKLFGVTTLDTLRANRFISEIVGSDPAREDVSVVGGHSGVTIVPLISQTQYSDTIPKEKADALIQRIQHGGDEVVKAKDGAGSATLSMAQAGARFAGSVLSGLAGEQDVLEATYIDSPLFKDEGIEFFASRVTLGPQGVKEIHGLGLLSVAEEDMIATAKETLRKNIKKGIDFVKANA
ncbi:Malate dehydrogenase, cytoplasmic [Brettanomyces nanus]|uniref:Malate dehydrogenase n=1 Tax=Eeniella nana TaxID=13502 RepID=A0A875RUS5_EENNA|nr:Malate dehydrogenase, cytoplasmic [Brettanomyces nanus]QPG74897.1 Malate dehydrogenase, cytoplasmic [Brettanomyces nanus]